MFSQLTTLVYTKFIKHSRLQKETKLIAQKVHFKIERNKYSGMIMIDVSTKTFLDMKL